MNVEYCDFFLFKIRNSELVVEKSLGIGHVSTVIVNLLVMTDKPTAMKFITR
jgi:hypothetical protein